MINEVRAYFAKLELAPEVAELYLALHTYGPQTISQLSRNAGVERTRIYRLIDELAASPLIEVETHYKRHILKAAPVGNLQVLLSKKEQELVTLQEGLDHVGQLLSTGSGAGSPFTHVQFYKGSEGIKQMIWNQTKATTEIVCILNESMQRQTNSAFFDRWVRTINERGVRSRGVINDHFIKKQQEWYSAHSNERLKHWQSRRILPGVFPIRHSTIAYNNVVLHYNWMKGEIFGIEIYNQDIADAQRRFFEMLWQQAKPVKVKLGGAEAMP